MKRTRSQTNKQKSKRINTQEPALKVVSITVTDEMKGMTVEQIAKAAGFKGDGPYFLAKRVDAGDKKISEIIKEKQTDEDLRVYIRGQLFNLDLEKIPEKLRILTLDEISSAFEGFTFCDKYKTCEAISLVYNILKPTSAKDTIVVDTLYEVVKAFKEERESVTIIQKD